MLLTLDSLVTDLAPVDILAALVTLLLGHRLAALLLRRGYRYIHRYLDMCRYQDIYLGHGLAVLLGDGLAVLLGRTGRAALLPRLLSALLPGHN